jgi:hypothetical protein
MRRPIRGSAENNTPREQPQRVRGTAPAPVRFHKTSRIRADRTFDKRLADHVKDDLLILGDFAMREFTVHEWRREW